MQFLNEDETIDQLHRNDYVIIQNRKNFCFGIDSVLLSDFAKIRKNEIGIDLCTGNGIVPILMCAKYECAKIFAVDIQKYSIDLMKRSLTLNKLENKIMPYQLDIKNIFEKFKKNYFNVVTVNPPYIPVDSGQLNKHDPKTIARHEVLCDLDDVLKVSSELLVSQGRFYLVHKANRLVDIIEKMRKYKLEPKLIRFIQPYLNKEPNLVLIEAVKNGNAFLKILPNLIIYQENNKYTEEVYSIYYN